MGINIGRIFQSGGSTIVNGVRINVPSGSNISIIDGQVYVDGKPYESEDLKDKSVVTLIIDGNVNNVTSDVSVTCRNVEGNVKAGTSVTCDNVKGNVVAGTSISCDDISGDAKAGTSINCDEIHGDANAMKITKY